MIRSTAKGTQRYLDMLSKSQVEGTAKTDIRGAWDIGGRSNSVAQAQLKKELVKLRKENERLKTATKDNVIQLPSREEQLRLKAKQQWAQNYSKPTQFGNLDNIKSVGNGL